MKSIIQSINQPIKITSDTTLPASMRAQVHREHVEGVGHVLVLDVEHTPAAMRRFRSFTGQRGRGVCAVTDAPMIQVEFSGDRCDAWPDDTIY